MKLYLAPMEGITNYVYRNAHHKYFGGIDRYYTPFIAPNQAHCFSTREKRDVLPENNEGVPVVPQILTNKSEHFIRTAQMLADMGYDEVNLNLGCPSGTVTAKKRGAGFLSDINGLDLFLNEIFDVLEGKIKISVKTRLGVEDPEEFETVLSIYDEYPLEELIIHPRVQQDFYKGTPRMEFYKMAIEESRHSLCYNGNIFTVADYETFHREFPETDVIMLGRGVIANPNLPKAIIQESRLDPDTFMAFHQAICDGYISWQMGDRNVLFKLKELWYYLGHLFPDGKKELKKIKKTQTLKAYHKEVESLVRHHDIMDVIIF